MLTKSCIKFLSNEKLENRFGDSKNMKKNKTRKLTLLFFSIITLIAISFFSVKKINKHFEFSPNLSRINSWLTSPFREKDPDRPRIGFILSRGYLGEMEQYARLSKILDERGCDYYCCDASGNSPKYLPGLHKTVHKILKPDFVFVMQTDLQEYKGDYTYAWISVGKIQNQSPHFLFDYDGYLDTHEDSTDLIQSLSKIERSAPVIHYLPSAPRSIVEPAFPNKVFFCGNMMDHRATEYLPILKNLHQQKIAVFYGPDATWKNFGFDGSYLGHLPADGVAVIKAIREAGIALCLHSKTHNQEAIPSARVFEACAAGAVIISDKNPYIMKHFGDCILYVDHEKGPDVMGAQIQEHIKWILDNPDAAREKARKANAVFNKNFALEKWLDNLVAMHQDFIRAKSRLSQ